MMHNVQIIIEEQQPKRAGILHHRGAVLRPVGGAMFGQ
jgi:hypothetical protein